MFGPTFSTVVNVTPLAAAPPSVSSALPSSTEPSSRVAPRVGRNRTSRKRRALRSLRSIPPPAPGSRSTAVVPSMANVAVEASLAVPAITVPFSSVVSTVWNDPAANATVTSPSGNW